MTLTPLSSAGGEEGWDCVGAFFSFAVKITWAQPLHNSQQTSCWIEMHREPDLKQSLFSQGCSSCTNVTHWWGKMTKLQSPMKQKSEERQTTVSVWVEFYIYNLSPLHCNMTGRNKQEVTTVKFVCRKLDIKPCVCRLSRFQKLVRHQKNRAQSIKMTLKEFKLLVSLMQTDEH